MKRVIAVLVLLAATAPARAQGDYQKGVSYYKQGQYDKAAKEFEPIVKDQPNYEFGHRILGFCYLKLKRYDKAVASLREAIKLRDDSYESYRALALAYFNQGSFQQALPTLDKAERLAKTPREKYDVFSTRGAAAFNVANYSRAASDLEKAVNIQRGNPADILQLGISYYRLGQYDKAGEFLRQAAALEPNQEEARRYLGRLGYQQGVDLIEKQKYSEAAKLLRAYTEANPNDADGWFNLGLAYLFADSLSAAEESLLRCLKLAPDNGEAHDRIGYVYEKKKQYQKALASYRKAFQLTGAKRASESVERVKTRIERARQGG